MSIKILLAGGGSGGPVAPLLAVAEALKKLQPKAEFLLVGSKNGPEEQMAKNAGIEFRAIPAGKWRRYFSLKNLAAPFFTIAGIIAAYRILKKFKPECVFGAGSYVQVPIIWTAFFLRIPCVIHQQDIQISFANRLCEPFVKKITVCFEKSITDFTSNFNFFYSKSKSKIIQTGNPFREELKHKTRTQALKNLNLRSDIPVLLVLGGGTGSDFINKLVVNCLPELSRTVQIIHSWGVRNPKIIAHDNYCPFEFIADMASAYAASDIVLSRAGLSTLTELSNLAKISIIIAMPGTHQEYNASLLHELNAAICFDQKDVSPKGIVAVIRKLLFKSDLQKDLAKNISRIMPKNAGEKIAKIIIDVIEKYGHKPR